MNQQTTNDGGDEDAEDPIDAVGTRSDLRLTERALRNHWEIPDKLKSKLLNRAAKIGLKSKSERNALRAIQVILNADKQSQAAIKLEADLPPQQQQDTDPEAVREALRQLDRESRKALEDRERDRLAAAYPGALRDARESGSMAASEAPVED